MSKIDHSGACSVPNVWSVDVSASGGRSDENGGIISDIESLEFDICETDGNEGLTWNEVDICEVGRHHSRHSS